MTSTDRRYDPMAADFQRALYDVYAWLRAEQPVYRDPDRNLWAVSRHADVVAVLADWQRFSSRTPNVPQPDGHLAVQDPPRHDELRRLVSQVFTPRRIAGLEPVVQRVADELVAPLRDATEVELVTAFAAELPSRVFAEMMGIPAADRAAFGGLLTAYLAAINATADGLPLDDAPRVAAHDAIARLVEQRRAEPGPDLLTLLLAAEVDGARLTESEILGFCFNLILAANETTTNLVANGVAILSAHPAALARLRAEPALLPAAIEEMLRYESPVQSLHRTTTCDVELAGRTIPAGAHVAVLYGAANRDETVFADAARFDLDRPAQRHVAFGHGIHFCLGAHLARLEARVAFAALLPLLDGWRPADEPPAWKRSSWQRSLARLRLVRR